MTEEDLRRYGYAPGSYWHRHCSACDDSFIADKRAINCRACVKILARADQPEKIKAVDFGEF